MASTPRTFVLRSPHMKGEDVRRFQRELNGRYKAWRIGKRIDEDGDYGKETRTAAREVCAGLGILPDVAMRKGVTPHLRTKIRHPDKRTASELSRSRGAAAKALRAKLREAFDGAGQVVMAPGANKPGRPMQRLALDYVGRMARHVGKPIVVTTGTNHSKFTVNGKISDHFSGHAADIGMIANGGSNDSPVGDRIMAAALIEAGMSKRTATAKARAGGLFTLNHAGMRIQCIWKTNEGGNHHNHVHVGVRPA